MRHVLIAFAITAACGFAAAADDPVPVYLPQDPRPKAPPQLVADFVAAAKKSPRFIAWTALTAAAVGVEAQKWEKAVDLPVVVERADFGCFTATVEVAGKRCRLVAATSMPQIQSIDESRQPLLWRLDARAQLMLTDGEEVFEVDADAVKDLFAADAIECVAVEPPLARRVDFTVERESLTRVVQRLAGLAKCDYSIRNDLADAISVTLALHDQTIAGCIDAIAPAGWTVEQDGPRRLAAPVSSVIDAWIQRDDLNRQLPAELQIKTPIDACRAVVFDAADTIKRARRTLINIRGPQPKAAN